VSVLPLEFNSEQSERLNLMPFAQRVVGCLVTSGRETLEEIDGCTLTPLFRSVERFSHSIIEPDLIHALLGISH
jgi:hypothetical protein